MQLLYESLIDFFHSSLTSCDFYLSTLSPLSPSEARTPLNILLSNMKHCFTISILLFGSWTAADGFESVEGDGYAQTSDPICVPPGPNSCQGVLKCDNATLGILECFFWVYDTNCNALRPADPWPGVRAGDSFSFNGLDHDVQIQNATGDLDKDKIDVVFKYANGVFGDGQSQYVRGDCSSATQKCAFMRSAFICK
jgi:hypothetical protein